VQNFSTKGFCYSRRVSFAKEIVNNDIDSIRLQLDATHELDGKLLALYHVGDKLWINHFLEIIWYNDSLDITDIIIPKGASKLFQEITERYSVKLIEVPVENNTNININIDVKYLFIPSKLSKLIQKRSNNIESAYITEIKSINDLKSSESFMFRDGWLVSSRYLNMPLAKFFALKLRNTSITPNQITVMTFVAGIAATVFASLGTYSSDVAAAIFLQIALTLDLTDGYLARLTYKSSVFGHWFDTYIDSFLNIAIVVGVVIGAGIDEKPYLAGFGAIWIISFHSTSCNFWFKELFKLRNGEQDDLNKTEASHPPIYELKLKHKFKNAAKFILNACSGLDSKFHIISILLILNMKSFLIVGMALVNLALFILSFFEEYKKSIANTESNSKC
jgi:phosphatidylglycerophosphate synthase